MLDGTGVDDRDLAWWIAKQHREHPIVPPTEATLFLHDGQTKPQRVGAKHRRHAFDEAGEPEQAIGLLLGDLVADAQESEGQPRRLRQLQVVVAADSERDR